MTGWSEEEPVAFLSEKPEPRPQASHGTDGCDATSKLRNRAASPEVQKLTSAGFHLLLERGEPISVEELAAAAGLASGEVRRLLDGAAVRGRVRLDHSGHLVGIAGLTVEPTRHEIRVDGKSRWTWCALDAVGILGALQADGSVVSRDPGFGKRIEIEYSGGVPVDDATLFVLGGYEGNNVVDDWCPRVNFFANRGDAEAWIDANGLRGDIVSVAQVADDAAEMWKPVVAGSITSVE